MPTGVALTINSALPAMRAPSSIEGASPAAPASSAVAVGARSIPGHHHHPGRPGLRECEDHGPGRPPRPRDQAGAPTGLEAGRAPQRLEEPRAVGVDPDHLGPPADAAVHRAQPSRHGVELVDQVGHRRLVRHGHGEPGKPQVAHGGDGRARRARRHAEPDRDPVEAEHTKGRVVQQRGQRVGDRIADDADHGRGGGGPAPVPRSVERHAPQPRPRWRASASLASCPA